MDHNNDNNKFVEEVIKQKEFATEAQHQGLLREFSAHLWHIPPRVTQSELESLNHGGTSSITDKFVNLNSDAITPDRCIGITFSNSHGLGLVFI